MSRARVLLIGLLFLVSGFTGLVYEVIWAKYLALLLGSSATAQVGVLAVFMGGLALGTIVWGRFVDRGQRALRLYGWLEIGIGVCAAVFTLGFETLERGYWSLLAAVANAGIAAGAVKTGLCVVAMLLPTFCMGGTLPVLTRALGGERARLGRGVAYLYALNSVGAAIGAVLTGFYLVARWGFDAPFLGAAVLNIGIGVIAIACERRWNQGATRHAPRAGGGPAESVGDREAVRGYGALVLVAAAVSGAVAMVYEVAWIRLCSLVLGSSTYSFSVMLAAFIVGIAGGSLVYTGLDPAGRRPLRFFAWTSLAAAALLLLCLPWYDRLPYGLGRLTAVLGAYRVSFATYQAVTLLFCVVVMLPLTFISGLNFPALTQAAARVRAGVGRPVSQVLFANTAGTIVGTVVGGLYLLPAIGLRATFLIGIAATVLVACLVLGCDRDLRWRGRIVAGALLSLAAYVVAAPAWDLRLLVAGEFRRHEGISGSFAEYRAGLVQEVVFYQDGVDATVSVERQRPDDVVLRVNGKADASAIGDRDTQLLLGHLPAVLRPAARRALVIGYGSGMTMGALLQHPLESVDVVEISPAVIAAAAQFRPYNHDPLHDRRTHLYLEDARTFLYRTPRRYDLIISEPSNPWIAGIGNLFTDEFFAQARSRLTPDGVLVQWFHSYETSNELVRLVLRTVAHEFGEVRVFLPNPWDLLLMASPRPYGVSRAARLGAFQQAGELREIGITRLSTLLGLELLPDAAVRRLAGNGPRNRDRMPRLEYAAPRAFFEGHNATLLATADPLASGFVQSMDALTLDEERDLAGYLARTDMGQYNQMLRVLAVWLARVPDDATALQQLSWWMSGNAGSPSLLRALLATAPQVAPAVRQQYAQLLLRVVWSLHMKPERSEVAAVAPVVQEFARGAEELKRLAELYVATGEYAQAVRQFDAALARPAVTPALQAGIECGRGAALEQLAQPAAARVAYERCLRAAPSDPSATAALQRLAVSGSGGE